MTFPDTFSSAIDLQAPGGCRTGRAPKGRTSSEALGTLRTLPAALGPRAGCGSPAQAPPRRACSWSRRGLSGSSRGQRAAPTQVLRPARRRAREAGSWRRRGQRGPGAGAALRTRAAGVVGPRSPEPSRRRPARSRPGPRRQGLPSPLASSPGGRQGTFPAPRARPAPGPAPPPPRVFRPSNDCATQISLGCPLPSGREGIERRVRVGHFQGASPEPLKVLFSPQVEGVGVRAGKGPLPSATHARIVVSKIKHVSPGEKDRSLLFSGSPPPSLAMKGKKHFLEVGGETKRMKKLQCKEIAPI